MESNVLVYWILVLGGHLQALGKAEVLGFNFNSSDFSRIMRTSAFVDKTMFIKEFLKNNKTCVMLAPPKFGKSTVVDMLRRFLELEVDEEGRPVTRANFLTSAVRDTSNYKLFVDEKLKITEEEKLMNEFFGRVPVLSVSFQSAGEARVRSVAEAVAVLREVVHEAYRLHGYLASSRHVSEAQRGYVASWCHLSDHSMFGQHRVGFALRELTEYLRLHHGSRVMVLVDGHDHVTRRAELEGDQLEDVVKLSAQIISSVFQDNDRNVRGGVVTGVSPLPEPTTPSRQDSLEDHPGPGGERPRQDLHVYEFLGVHPFAEFFGFTGKEVDRLLVYPKLKIGDRVIDEAKDKYDGYRTLGGEDMYNSYSLLNFLDTGEFLNYWSMLNPIPNLNAILKAPFVSKHVSELLKGRTINVDIIQKPTIKDVLDLRNFTTDPTSQPDEVAAKFFTLLKQEGYVVRDESASGKQTEKVSLKIPNEEIRAQFMAGIEDLLNFNNIE